MSRNVLLATWADNSKAYEAFVKLKSSGLAGINHAAIFAKKESGHLELVDGGSTVAGAGTATGSLIGMLIGILGGPLGMLLGFSTGALLGSLNDLDAASEDAGVLGQISKSIQPGQTALLVDLDEASPALADAYFRDAGAILQRWSYDEVEAEVEASAAAIDAARLEASEKIKEQKQEENKTRRQEAWTAFKKKFHL